jgi:hypothetical protein
MAAKKKSLEEAIAESIRISDTSGMRELVEKYLAEPDRPYGDGPCSRALDPLLEIVGRHDKVKERFLASGHDWFATLDNTEAPRWEEWTTALEKGKMNTYEALKTWKKACMRRRPGEG